MTASQKKGNTAFDLAEYKKNRRFREVLRMFLKNKLAVIGLVVFIFIVLVAIFADVIVDERLCYDISGEPLQGPSAEHPFGTDQIGRDYFARIVHGARVSIVTGVAATALSMVFGAFIGCACGYFGGWVDNLFMRFFDT